MINFAMKQDESPHSSSRLAVRLIIIALSLFIYFPLNSYYASLIEKQNSPTMFTFQTPLPQQIMEHYRLKEPLSIDRVILAGTFNNWDLLDSSYLMKQINSNTWQLAIVLPPEENRYKFVLFLKNEARSYWPKNEIINVVWCEDMNAPRLAKNKRGGLTSTHPVPPVTRYQSTLQLLTLWLCTGLILLTLLEWLSKLLFRFPISFRFKLVIMVFILIITTNISFLWHSVQQYRQLMQRLLVDQANTIHIMLAEDTVNIIENPTPGNRTAFRQKISHYLNNLRYRSRYNTFNNFEQSISGIFLHDDLGNLLEYEELPTIWRGEYNFYTNQDFLHSNYTLRAAEIHTYIKKNHSQYRQQPLFLASELLPSDTPLFKSSANRERFFRRAYRLFPYNFLYYPIVHEQNFIGYYLIPFNPQAYNFLLSDILFSNLILIVIFIFLYFILLNQLGKTLLNPLNKLIVGLRFIRNGDFNYQLNVSTQDEIQELGEAYNYMSQELKITHEKLQDYAKGLEDKVKERTKELQSSNKKLENALSDITAMQKQIVSQEKMASLGLLTAGIAHEIKNPLNFVTNFSSISVELITELKELLAKDKLDKNTREEILDLFQTLADNVEKIELHGKRADSIIRTMLLHSQGSSSEKHPVDINHLIGETVQLVVYGFRANHPQFTVKIHENFDDKLPKIPLPSQDFSRVLVNILNNACYAMKTQKDQQTGGDYFPELTLSTARTNQHVEIRIKDNGTGIPAEIQNKIFQPFFTTKPTGSGTGLGLSLAFDIVTNQCGGTLGFNSEEGHFTEFIITLPLKK